ncbi:MAG: redoxin domain-containing protein [Alphaproteobacteria bacterium]|nr:redoxin domain-containing protein [Alphaproteobacteria bacterium]
MTGRSAGVRGATRGALVSRRALGIAAGAAAALALTLGALSFSEDAAAAVASGGKAPAFSVVDASGKTRSLAEFAGKTVVLEWTNHECPFVKKHYDTGNMQKLQKAAAADGVVWLSVVSSAPGKQGAVSGAEAVSLTTSRGAAPTAVLLDASGVVGKAYGAKTTPHMFVITPKGDIAYQGAIDDTPAREPETVKTAKNYVTAALAAVKAGKAPAVTATQPYGCTVKYAS